MVVKVPGLPYSEVCMSMGIAGKEAVVKLLPHNMAQIYLSGQPYSAPVTRGEAGVEYGLDEIADLVVDGYRKPGDKIVIDGIDPYGLNGRDLHPPVNPHEEWVKEEGKPYRNVSPLEGKVGYVVHYEGWDNGDGDFITRSNEANKWLGSSNELFSDTYIQGTDPEVIYAMAIDVHDEHAVVDPDTPATHYYLVVFPDMGTYQIADYEMEEVKVEEVSDTSVDGSVDPDLDPSGPAANRAASEWG